jgi:HSP20 family molecular chaperone IbpA
MKRAPKSAIKVAVLEDNSPISTETEAIQERVRQRAFERSHTRPPDAHSLYDWLMAESEIISVPPAELIEKNGAFELKFAVAGVSPENIHVMVARDQIVLKSEYDHQHAAQIGTVHLCDFKSATVFRSVPLPKPIDVKSVKVHFVDGMVIVTASAQGAQQSLSKRTTPARKAVAATKKV